MDERAIKRLLIIVAVCLIAIFLIKAMMSKTIINLNKVAIEKKQTAARPPAGQQADISSSDTATVIETPAVSTVDASATLEPSTASGVSEAR